MKNILLLKNENNKSLKAAGTLSDVNSSQSTTEQKVFSGLSRDYWNVNIELPANANPELLQMLTDKAGTEVKVKIVGYSSDSSKAMEGHLRAEIVL